MTFKASGRIGGLDAIRAVAAQMIVLHHLAFYGPMAERVAMAAPELIGWLINYARIAVQVFLVLGGFLAAGHIDWKTRLGALSVARSIGRRYIRLFVPFAVAVMCTLVAGALTRPWVGDADWMPDPPTLGRLLAHAALIFSYLNVEAFTPGAWYVTVDLELHIVLILLVWIAQRVGIDQTHARWYFKLSVVLLTGISALIINRDPKFNITSLYFFGSFALGIAAYWLSALGASRSARLAGIGVVGIVLVALTIDFRVRLAVALLCALTIVLLVRLALMSDLQNPSISRGLTSRALGWLGQTAYSLFLVHFPVALIANALYLHFFAGDLSAAWGGMLIAWLGSIPIAWLMWWGVELRLLGRLSSASENRTDR